MGNMDVPKVGGNASTSNTSEVTPKKTYIPTPLIEGQDSFTKSGETPKELKPWWSNFNPFAGLFKNSTNETTPVVETATLPEDKPADRNLNLLEKELVKLINNPRASSDFLKSAYGNPNMPQEELVKLVNNPHASSDFLKVAYGNPNMPQEELVKLVNSSYSSSDFLKAAYGNPNMPQEELVKLVNNPHASSDFLKAAYRNPNMPQEELVKLVNNPHASSDFLKAAYGNPSSAVVYLKKGEMNTTK